MRASTIEHYARLSDREERARQSRRPQFSDGLHPMTKGWAKYRPNEARVIVRNVDGRQVSLSPTQHRVLTSARMLEGRQERVTVSAVAASIGVAVSSVTRALTVLAAWKLLAYDVIRGRYGGIRVFALAWADLKARSRSAWERLAWQKQRAWDRYLAKLDRTHYFTAGFNFALPISRSAKLNEETSQ